jgi:hypothetical protein
VTSELAGTAAKKTGAKTGGAKPADAKTADAKPADAKAEARLPRDRAALLVLHRELRHRRDALPLLSEERAETVIEVARVEVQIARVERAMDPPLG